MLFLLLAFPLYASAQPPLWDIFLSNKDIDSIGQRIHMPANVKYTDIIDHRQKTGSFVITTDSVYRKFSWRFIYTNDSLKRHRNAAEDPWYAWMKKYHVDSIPHIDFSKHELVIYIACYYCLTVCDDNVPCHRNACSYMEKYFLRKKTTIINKE